MQKNIVICNAHWSNRGDEAAIRVYLDWLLENRPDDTYHMIIKDGREVQQFPYNTKVTAHSSKFLPRNFLSVLLCTLTRGHMGGDMQMKRDVKTYRKADAVIYAPGGAVISDRFWWRKQLEYLLPFLASKLYHIPMYVAAPSMGPYDTKKNWRNFVRKNLLSQAKCFCVREEFSKQYLKSIGLKTDIEVTIDSAFYENEIQKKEYIALDEELQSFFQVHNRVIGMTITDFSWHVEYNKKALRDKIIAEMKKIINYLADKSYGVLLIPQLFGNQNDSRILEKYRRSHVCIMDEKYDTYIQQKLVGRCFAVIGMRYHSNIFAAKAAVPFIAIAYEEKMTGFMEAACLQEWCIDLQNLSSQNVLDKFSKLLESYEEIKGSLEKKRMEWENTAKKNITLLDDFLMDNP